MSELATITPSRPAPGAGVRARVYRHLETTRGQPGGVSSANIFLAVLIVSNVAALVVESVPGMEAYAGFFRVFELVSIAVFSVEYLLRVWSAPENVRYADGWRGRLRYMATPMALIDLVAVLPFYLPLGALDLRMLRVLRLLRLLRLAKLARYSVAAEVLGDVLKAKRHELAVVLALVVILVLCSASLMYFVERDTQPDVFSSIPAAAWWSIVTLTTIGYGDAVPHSMTGRVIGSVVALFGIGVVALPAGMLGAAFTEALARRREADGRCPHCGQITRSG
jgi:voltage-gated potassium channel